MNRAVDLSRAVFTVFLGDLDHLNSGLLITTVFYKNSFDNFESKSMLINFQVKI